MADSMKVALGIEQLRTRKLLFGGHSSSEFRMPKWSMTSCQCLIAKATFIELGI